MIKKESEILTERIKKWYTYLPKLFINDERIFTAKLKFHLIGKGKL